MKVWIVEEEVDWGCWNIMGAFDSEEKAKECVERLKKFGAYVWTEWEVE